MASNVDVYSGLDRDWEYCSLTLIVSNGNSTSFPHAPETDPRKISFTESFTIFLSLPVIPIPRNLDFFLKTEDEINVSRIIWTQLKPCTLCLLFFFKWKRHKMAVFSEKSKQDGGSTQKLPRAQHHLVTNDTYLVYESFFGLNGCFYICIFMHYRFRLYWNLGGE